MTVGLVSVIITTYNRDYAMLKEAVDSVRAQTYTNIEIIVVDDNKDNSLGIEEKLKEYPDIRYIKMKKNSGAPAARNTGIQASHGEFIALLDDDDLWAPEKLEKQIPCFEYPQVGLVFCQGYVVDDTKQKQLYRAPEDFKTQVSFEMMLEEDVIGATSQAVVKRTAFDDCGMFDVNFPARQDYEMWLRILKKYKAFGVEEPLFYMRTHSGERITSNPMRGIHGFQKVYKKYKKDFKRNKKAQTNILNEISWRLWKQAHRYPESIWYGIKLFLVNPGFILEKDSMRKYCKILKLFLALLLIALLAFVGWKKVLADQDTLELSFYHVKSSKLESGFRIVQLSDLHLKEFGENNSELVERVKSLSPDIIAITGDSNMAGNDDYHVVLDLCEQLVQITDVYYVFGNHEQVDYAHRKTKIRDDIEKTGVHNLYNSAEEINVNGNNIYIGGLINETNNYEQYGGKKFIDEFVTNEDFKLLLVHYPEYFLGALADESIDLALCGHDHGGIVRIPFLGAVYSTEQGLLPKLTEGMNEINDSTVITSRGLGESHSLLRINNKPEIVVIDLNWY